MTRPCPEQRLRPDESIGPHIRAARVTVARLLRRVHPNTRVTVLQDQLRCALADRGWESADIEGMLTAMRTLSGDHSARSELGHLRNVLIMCVARSAMDQDPPC